MRYYADLHIHSKYSRACSKDCDIEHLTWWARRKGITVVGTGDFTHPAWFDHLREVLEPAEPGLFQLRADLARDIDRTLPPSCAGQVRFMLSVEISTIYKYGDYTRKVHHLCYMPDFAAAAEFNRRLGRIGNLGSDGRPILGLDSRDLLEITLESGDGAYLVPAHIWTPWFAVLGSKAGFNAIDDCYRDLADHIFAVETGLSSDPEMNWRISMLDRYSLVSHSDAHSPPMLGREATVFDTAVDYFAIRDALRTGDGFDGTVEFFPEEGKYHADGHRKCGIRFGPAQTRAHNGQCPSCARPLTVGVLNRVAELADRPAGFRPPAAAGFRNLIPLPEIVGEVLGVGPKSKTVRTEIDALTAAHGPELAILEDIAIDELSRSSEPIAEAVRRLRSGEVIREAGYDGEYGTIRLFEQGELRRLRTNNAPALFEDSLFESSLVTDAAPATPEPRSVPAPTVDAAPSAPPPEPPASPVSSLLEGLDEDQRRAATLASGPSLIVAGPGTGKTRTVTHRIAHHVVDHGLSPDNFLAITFTRRAAAELADRLHTLIGPAAELITVATFHSLGLRLLREQHARAGLPASFGVADAATQRAVLTDITGDAGAARKALAEFSRIRRADDPTSETGELLARYTAELRARDLVDFDELVLLTVHLLEDDARLREDYQHRYRWITVDEYQDIDEMQYRLLRQLAPPEANLTAIGDPDQAIYSFRGADVGFFLRFTQDYPGAPVTQLTRNYRSGASIVDGSLQAVRPSTLVADRALHAARSTPDHPITVHRAADERAEASFVADTIDQLLGGASFHSLDSGLVPGHTTENGVGFADIAVLYRTDAQSSVLLTELGRRGFPVQKRSHDPLTARAGVDHIVRELTHARTDPGQRSVADLVRTAAAAARRNLAEQQLPEVHTALDLLMPLAERCGRDLTLFERELVLGAETDTLDPRADAISLLTLHAAKGLEYPVVFLVGCEDGLLPLRWPGSEPEDALIAEERRLFFVGMTRAQDRLFLSHAARRHRPGSSPRATVPTRFLRDVPSAVRQDTAGVARRPRARQLSLL
ncbi:uncharacterized protein (TIGR00375 family) [Tamaricihabitans halophyticus]|uniref:DNA 3'-5' helicase n=1 Tax=Tamaricihabitans halophyticus TaxID=1262583 RepID=A0A4V2STP0_9PSEU|nr:UvrD-helicase domain-containing protein [Tamaricihabitans halophyticus]TCP50926.1 uncharacterized protein (TIGR00375 family) [Tamaricihabitans halophyticus]